MKRVHLQKEKPVPYFHQETADSPSAQPDQAPPGARRRARTSAAMIGLALSMGATSLLVPQQDDGAAAAEPKLPDHAISAVLSHDSIAQPEIQPSGTAQSSTVRLVEHVVRDGQTLQQLATQYHISVRSIALANNLSPDSTLKAGQTLKIPVPDRASTTDQPAASSLVASADLGQLPAAAPAAPQGTDRNAALDRLRQQRDKLRDSLAELRSEGLALAANPAASSNSNSSSSNTSNTSNTDLAATGTPNSQQNTQTEIADTLAVLPSLQPAAQQPNRPAVANQVAMRPSQPGVSTSGIQTYRVNPGDTLARIARAYNIPQSLLIDANHLSDPNVIFVGQVLTVPAVQSTSQSTSPQPPVAVASEALSTGMLPAVAPIGGAAPSAPVQQATHAIQPAISPVAPAVPTRIAQAAPTPVQPAAALPGATRQVAVAPLPAATSNTIPAVPGVDVNPGVDADLSSRFNPYVANLLSELRGLRHQPTATAVQPAVTPAVAVNPTPAGNTAIASHFSASRNADTLPVSNSVQAATAAPTAQPNLVAAAPLGSESYDPLLQPVTGRLVSPDLPPLPGADSFLPKDGLFNGYIWPARGMLTSGYGWRWGRMHQGIDIAADVGTPIHAAADGTVEFAGWNSGGYGNMVEVRHADGSMTRYAHMNAIDVQVGQEVDQGEQIGEMGSTGYSTGPHLHFEVHLPNQGTVNPIAYLPADQQQAQAQ